MPALQLNTTHRRRLREIWRSAGWPCHDMVEVELLAAGLLQRVSDGEGRESLRVTDTGVQALADALASNRRARSAHDLLVARVAEEMAREGRIAWCALVLRAKVQREPPAATQPLPATQELFGADICVQVADAAAPGATWGMAMPDVFSVRHTTVAAYLQPMVHEIKVRRADLLSDLRHAAKRAAYLQMAGQCWYVLAEGIGEAEEIPAECGVMVARGEPAQARLEVLRPAPQPRRAFDGGLPFAVWMALARATPYAAPGDEQPLLGPADTPAAADGPYDRPGAAAPRSR